MEEFVEGLKIFLGDKRNLGRNFYKLAKRIYKDVKRQSKLGGII